MAATVFNRGKKLIADAFVANTTGLMMMLVTTGYTYSNDHDTVDDGTTNDPKSYEISVGGYSRQALAGDSAFEDDSNDFAGLDHANVTFSALVAGATVGSAILYRYSTSGGTTSDTGQDLVSAYAVTATPTNGGDIVIAIASTSDGALIKFGSTS
jgi:hypothetical protein